MIGYLYSSMMLSAEISWVTVLLFSLGLYTTINIISWLFLKRVDSSEMKPRIKVLDALKLPTVINYCACYACIKLMHLGILIWLPFYLEIGLKLNMRTEGIIMILYGGGGIIGGITSGYISDRTSDRSYVLVAMLIGAIPMVIALYFILGNSNVLSYLCILLVGGLVSGSSNLLSAVVAADMCDLDTEQEAKSTLTGLIDASGGVGAALGQIIVTYI